MNSSDKKSELAVILVSGGMDSLVCAAFALQSYRAAFLHLDYGQRTEIKERNCFEALVNMYQPEFFQIIDVNWLGKLGGSALTDEDIVVPQGGIAPRSMPVTYVPFRNSIFLSAAVAWAEVVGASSIFYGAVETDRAGYPDCRKEYVNAFNKLISTGTARGPIVIRAPLIDMTKKDIILLGTRLQVPFELSWSCYSQSTVACGKCESCVVRLQAFKEAGLNDPLPYLRI